MTLIHDTPFWWRVMPSTCHFYNATKLWHFLLALWINFIITISCICWVSLCWVSLCWVSLCWMSWHPPRPQQSLMKFWNQLFEQREGQKLRQCPSWSNWELVEWIWSDAQIREYWRGKCHCTVDLLFDLFGISCMTTDNFCFYLQNRLIKTSQAGGQQYCDTTHFSISCSDHFPVWLCTIKLFTVVIYWFS